MPIDRKHLEECIFEARRFVKRAEACLVVMGKYGVSDTRVSAAAKRSSMDLTRALARLRKTD